MHRGRLMEQRAFSLSEIDISSLSALIFSAPSRLNVQFLWCFREDFSRGQ